MEKDTNGRPTGTFVHDPDAWSRVAAVHAARERGCTYQKISTETGIPVSSLKSHLDAWSWVPPCATGSDLLQGTSA